MLLSIPVVPFTEPQGRRGEFIQSIIFVMNVLINTLEEYPCS